VYPEHGIEVLRCPVEDIEWCVPAFIDAIDGFPEFNRTTDLLFVSVELVVIRKIDDVEVDLGPASLLLFELEVVKQVAFGFLVCVLDASNPTEGFVIVAIERDQQQD